MCGGYRVPGRCGIGIKQYPKEERESQGKGISLASSCGNRTTKKKEERKNNTGSLLGFT